MKLKRRKKWTPFDWHFIFIDGKINGTKRKINKKKEIKQSTLHAMSAFV